MKNLGQQLHRISAWFAVAGGFALTAMVVLVVISILGRALFSSPVPGDFEIVALGTAVAIFLFLPYCYMQKGNVAVDIFISRMPAGVQLAMDVLAATLFGVVAALFAWRSVFGLTDTVRNGDISMILGFPVWVVHPFGVASFALLAVCCFYTAIETLGGVGAETHGSAGAEAPGSAGAEAHGSASAEARRREGAESTGRTSAGSTGSAADE